MGSGWAYLQGPCTCCTHTSRCDGSRDNYPLSRRICNCNLKQGFPSGSSPAQVSDQLMTFRSNRMKEMAVVCSRLHSTFVLLSSVCLNLPATVFTAQGDRVIRSPSLGSFVILQQCSSRGGLREQQKKKKKKENNINRQEATTSNVHHLLAHSLLYHHYSFRNHAGLICFFFFFPFFFSLPPFYKRRERLHPLLSSPLHL